MSSVSDRVILVGGFHEIIELCEICGKEIVGIIDNALKDEYYGCPILGKDDDAAGLFKRYHEIPLIVTPDSCAARQRLMIYYSQVGFTFCNLIHPNTTISKYASLGAGVVIQTHVNCSANVSIEDCVRINSHANIMHDCSIGRFSTIAPNAVVLGGVKVSEGCYVGANATILPNKNIGRNAVVGAGAVVTKDVRDGATVVGNPAREID